MCIQNRAWKCHFGRRVTVVSVYCRPCLGSGGYWPSYHLGDTGSSPSDSLWELWWTKCLWDKFSSEYFPFQPIPVIARSKAWVHGRSHDGIAELNPPGHGYLSVVTVACFQVDISGSGWSLVQRNPTDCTVSEYDREATIMRKPWPTRGCCAKGKQISVSIIGIISPMLHPVVPLSLTINNLSIESFVKERTYNAGLQRI